MMKKTSFQCNNIRNGSWYNCCCYLCRRHCSFSRVIQQVGMNKRRRTTILLSHQYNHQYNEQSSKAYNENHDSFLSLLTVVSQWQEVVPIIILHQNNRDDTQQQILYERRRRRRRRPQQQIMLSFIFLVILLSMITRQTIYTNIRVYAYSIVTYRQYLYQNLRHECHSFHHHGKLLLLHATTNKNDINNTKIIDNNNQDNNYSNDLSTTTTIVVPSPLQPTIPLSETATTLSSIPVKKTPSTTKPKVTTLTSPNSSSTVTKQLHEYTIKELRQMIESYITSTTKTSATTVDNNESVRNGETNPSSSNNVVAETSITWSKFKRKQDYINYLLQLQQHYNQLSSSAVLRPQQQQEQTSDVFVPLPTPILVDETDHSVTATAAIQQQQRKLKKMPALPQQQSYQSPKDIIVEQVYQRYPTLRPTTTTITTPNKSSTSTAFGSSSSYMAQQQVPDVRQEYHPVMKQLILDHGSSTQKGAAINPDETKHSVNDDSLLSTDIANSYSGSALQQVQSDMDIVCIGTASCTPGITRGVSCTAIRCNWNRRTATSVGGSSIDPSYVNGSSNTNTYNNNNNNGETSISSSAPSASGTWIFDVGECTQLQIQKTGSVKPGKITKIFLTHAHGDHTFGLPGLLCLMGQDRPNDAPIVDIYGPEGLRMWLRTAIRYSVSRIVPPYRVHEIMNIPMAPPWEYNPRSRRYYYKGAPENAQWNVHKGLAGEDVSNWISQSSKVLLEPSTMYGEVDGGRNIYPIYNHPLSVNGAPIWLIEDDVEVQIHAAPMSHGIPCVGYVIKEQPRAGRLRNEYVEPIVQRNKAALYQAGYVVPMRALAVIKNLPVNSTFTFPDGTIVRQEDAVEPERTGRKIAICGDTSCAMALSKLAYNADVVIHEATNAYLSGVDTKDATLSQVTRDAIIHGHSTPQMAAQFCRNVQGKILLMNHFSARYKGDPSVDSLSIMLRIEKQACQAAHYNESQVIAAWDMMVLPIPQH